jgi:4-amino-4-deoxy-L-arabinose transferase-like glycosyltransferase
MLARTVVQMALLTALATVFAFAHVADEPLEGDPAMYGTIAKTIVATGEWSRLTFNGESYFNKPPLHFWLNAAVFHVVAPTTFTAALVPCLLGVIDVLLLYVLCRQTLPGWQPAFLAALVYLTTPEVVHWGRGVHLETLVTLWVLLGLLAAHRSVRHPSAVLLLAAAAIGGWLAKGPQGLFPLLVAPILWRDAGVVGARLRSGWTLAAVVIAAGAVGAWIAGRWSETGFVATYFGEQIGHVLFVRGWFDRGPLWYVGKLLRTYWPWLPVALAGGVMLWRRRRTDVGARLWLAYLAVVMLVITAATVKKGRYLFQVYPALAALAGVALAAVAARVPRLPGWMASGAALAAAATLLLGGGDEPRPHVRDTLAVARRLPADATVLLTHDGQHGQPQVGKVLGFHAPPLVRSCRDDCAAEATPGAVIVARADEALRVAAAVAGAVTYRNDTLAIVDTTGGRVSGGGG